MFYMRQVKTKTETTSWEASVRTPAALKVTATAFLRDYVIVTKPKEGCLSWNQKNSPIELIPTESSLPLHVMERAPCSSLQPSFPITTENTSLFTQHPVENSSYRGEPRRQAPVWGSFAVRSCPRGAWNQQNFSKGKGCCGHRSPITTGETFQGLHCSHSLHSPGDSVCFQCEKSKW